MSLGKATVARIARLARLRLPEAALEPMAAELSAILSFVEQLEAVDTAAVAPMASGMAMRLRLRADEVTDGGKAEAILANAPEAIDGFFAVPKVVE